MADELTKDIVLKEQLNSPFLSYTKKKKKKDIEKYSDFEKTFIEAWEETFTPRKKPVKYTSKGAAEALISLTGSLQAKEEIFKKWRAEEALKPNQQQVIDGYREIAQSIYRGTLNTAGAASEMVLAPIDYAFDKDFITKFNKIMDKGYEITGEESKTLPSALTEILTEYAIPIGIATKVKNYAKSFNQIKNLGKYMGVSKTSKIAKRMAEGAFILGVAEPFVRRGSRPDMDYGIPWGILWGDPTAGKINKPINTKGLSGRKLAKATFINKFRFAREGTMIGGGFPLAAKGLQQTYKYTARYPLKGTLQATTYGTGKVLGGASYLLARTPMVPTVARITRDWSMGALTKGVAPMIVSAMSGKVVKQLPPFKEWRMLSVANPKPELRNVKRLDDFLSYFRSFGDKNLAMGTIDEGVKLTIKSKVRNVNKALEGVEVAAHRLAQGFETRYNKNTTSPVGEKYFLDKVIQYLKGQTQLESLPKELRFYAKEINDQMDMVRKAFGKALPKSKKFEDFRSELLNDLNKYMRASFATFTNEMYQPLTKVRKEANEWIVKNVIKKNKDFKKSAVDPKTGYPNVAKEKAYQMLANDTIENILHVGRTEGKDPIKALREIGFTWLRRDKYQFLNSGEELPTVIQSLLGKENNLRASVLTTYTDLISQLMYKKGYDQIARAGLNAKKPWLFADEASAISTVGAKQIHKIPNLGILPSEILNLHASAEIVNALKGIQNGGILNQLIQSSFYRHLLQFKLLTQLGKTVFSPQTQVRNVESAGLFPFVNGHIGGRSSVTDSLKIVLDDVFGAGKKIEDKKLFDFIQKEIRLGTMDENIIASELRAVLQEIKDGSTNTIDKLFNKMVKTDFVRSASRVYAGGDNVWKLYGRQWAKSQLVDILPNRKAALEYARYVGQYINEDDLMTGMKKSYDDIMDELSAWEIRNTYPTYSKVPPVIQALRKLPFGNFISFPAEILRTATRIMDLGLKQASHPNPRIRQMGLRRLMGASLGFYGLGAGLYYTTLALTGTTEDQWDAYKRSFAASWDKDKNLLPMTTFKDGKTKAVNFSYFSPYDVLQAPIQSALNKAVAQELNPEDTEDYVLGLMFDPDGPMMSLLEPFIAEQIGLERIQDIMPAGYFVGGRNGITGEGTKIYSPSDDLSTKFNKSFAHLMQGIEPGAWTTAKKIYGGATDNLTKGGFPIELRDEVLALFSGIRIINIDVPKSLGYKIAETNRLLRAVDDTEKFYSSTNFSGRGPDVILEEYHQIQEEAFRIQKDAFQYIKDARLIGVSDRTIREVLKDQNVPKKTIRNLMNGYFTPVNYSDARFQKKVKNVKAQAKRMTEKNKNLGFIAKTNYLYPKTGLDRIKRSWNQKRFELLDWQKEKEKPGLFKRLKKRLNPFKGFGAPKEQAKIPTPPLPQTPMPKLAANTQQKNPTTNLTRTEQALLSPSEKIIAGRT